MTAQTRPRFSPGRVLSTVGVLLLGLLPHPADAQTPIIVQTNAAGDNIHLIDARTNTIVGEISGIEVNHGATSAPDGSRFYITNEVDHTLDVVDARTLGITHKVPLSGRPNNVAIRGDGRRVYVAIVSAPGAVDVIDTKSVERVKSITTADGVHNTFITPDSKHVIAGSIAGRNLTVIDAETEHRCGPCSSTPAFARWRSRPTRTDRRAASSCSSPTFTASPSSTSRSGGK